jgi:hypothetical protein
VTGLDWRHRELLAVLVRHRVQFVLVGGVALQTHGFTGATVDVDITIAVDDRNAARIEDALNELRAAPYLTGDRGTAYRTTFGQLEVMRKTDGVGDYNAWQRNATMMPLEPELVVQVGSASDLLAAKEAAARDKDLAALPRIRAELLQAGKLSADDVRGPVAELPRPTDIDPRVADLLGARPDERRARGLWDHGAELIAAHRRRWEIHADSRDPLGDLAGSDAQRADRAALERQLARTARLLARLGHGRPFAGEQTGSSFPAGSGPLPPTAPPPETSTT